MTPKFFLDTAVVPALSLLPPSMDSPAARAQIIAICLQESRLKHRRQIGGPARGFPQFERGTPETRGGITGVLMHPATRPYIRIVLAALDYDPAAPAGECYAAIEHNDILAAAFSRLLLWTLPQPLPDSAEPQEAWEQYLEAWRPGKPHLATWRVCFETAWDTVRKT